MIQNSKLWSTPTGYLNDTTEYHHGSNRIRKLIAEFIDYPRDGDWKEVLRHLTPVLEGVDRNDVFVISFASDDDQLSQWRGYGADGHGYSVGFDTSSLTQVKPDPVVYKVVYDEDKQLRMCEYLLRDGMI